MCGVHRSQLFDRRRSFELILETFHASGRVHETLFSRVRRMAVGGHITDDDKMFNAVDLLGLGALHGRTGEELFAG